MSKKVKLKKVAKAHKKVTIKVKRKKKLDINKLIPSGITPLDLECSGTTHGAFLVGKLINIIGDSHSGKTLLFLTIIAECCYDKRFDDYDFYLDDVENALEFDIEEMFGPRVAKRLIIMDGNEGRPEPSETIEDFADTISDLLEKKRKFLYGLDSFDALDSEADRKKEKEDRKKRKAAKKKGNEAEITGSYGDGKPKIFSKFCKQKKGKLKRNASSVFVISQTRDNIGFGAMFNPKTRSGGKALKFYSLIELWLATQKDEKGKEKAKRTKVTNVQAKLTKNKITGQKGVCFFPIVSFYGIDNITACIDFLINEKYWKKNSSGKVDTKDFVDSKMTVKKLAAHIDKRKDKLLPKLKEECQLAYNKAIDKMKPKDRTKKYE